MALLRLHLVDFRGFEEATLEPDPHGTTVLTGPNGAGKTTFLEAVGFLGIQRSFRGASRDAMVRTGREQAFVRAELERDGAPVLVEAEISLTGRSRIQVNRQVARSRRLAAEAVPVTVFSPDDLGIVQDGPARRRELFDDALRLLDPTAASLLDEVDKVLRQRGALLRQSGGRSTPEVAATLDVWDERLAVSGTTLATARSRLALRLVPAVARSYAALAGRDDGSDEGVVGLAYRPSWEGQLGTCLRVTRADDLRRGTTTVGPHRDDIALQIGGRDARSQASQGEQRCLALSLRLGVHELVTEHAGTPPLLLLDDVFSELDPDRARSLVRQLPEGQSLVTTAVPLPDGVEVESTIDVRGLGGGSGGGSPGTEGTRR